MGFRETFCHLAETRGVMAEISRQTGISKAILCRYKDGVAPSFDNAILIADFFGVSLDWLAGRSADPVLHAGHGARWPADSRDRRQEHGARPRESGREARRQAARLTRAGRCETRDRGWYEALATDCRRSGCGVRRWGGAKRVKRGRSEGAPASMRLPGKVNNAP